MHTSGLSEYDQKNSFPVFMKGNLFLKMQNLLKNTKKNHSMILMLILDLILKES